MVANFLQRQSSFHARARGNSDSPDDAASRKEGYGAPRGLLISYIGGKGSTCICRNGTVYVQYASDTARPVVDARNGCAPKIPDVG